VAHPFAPCLRRTARVLTFPSGEDSGVIHSLSCTYKFTIDKRSGPLVRLRVLSRTNLTYPSRRSSPKSHRLILLRTLCRRQKRQLLWNQPNPNSFCKIPWVGYPECNYGTPGVGVSPSSMPLCLCGNPDLSPRAKDCKNTETATAFRMNTCKSVSKQTTLTTFRMNTYAKRGEGGYPDSRFSYPPLTTNLLALCRPSYAPRVRPLSPVASTDCAYFPSPREWAPYALRPER
jgi:hypothetical protein